MSLSNLGARQEDITLPSRKRDDFLHKEGKMTQLTI